MNGMLKIGVLKVPPLATNCALDPVCPRRGFAVDTAMMFCQLMKLDCLFELYESEDFGDADEQGGNTTGMVNEIITGRYDTSLPIFTPTYRRYQAIDFSDIYFIFDSVLITRAPGERSVYEVNSGIVNGFQTTVWCVFAVSFFACMSLFVCLLRHSNLIPLDRHVTSIYSRVFLGLIAADHNPKHAETIPIRILFGSWLLSCVVVSSLYTGMLFSNKLMDTRKPPYTDMDSFVECLERRECRIITHTPSITFVLLLTEGGSEYSKRISNTLTNNPLMVVEIEKIPQTILNERGQYLTWHWPRAWFVYGLSGAEICKYHMITTPFPEVDTFPVRKNYSLLPEMNRVAAAFRENAWEHYVRQRYFHTTACNDHPHADDTVDEKGRWFYSFGTISYFYYLGMGSAAMTIGIEVFVHRIWNRNRA